MATVNRYTNISTPRYTPRTLQEMMMVPAYKREQHNNIDLGIAESNAALAQADGMALHDPAMKAEQDRLYNSLQEQAAKLEEEGFSQASKSNFLNFNADYQKSIGPKGVLGKIGTAKTQLAAEKEAYIKNATAAGFPPDAAGRNWDRHVEKYGADFDANSTVKNIDSLYAPKYHDATTELTTLLSKAGLSTSEIANFGSKIITDDPKNPGHYMLSGGSKLVTADNIVQLQAAVDYMNNQVNNPNSSIGQSIAHEGKTPETVLSELSGLAPIFRKDKYGRETTSQISGFKSNAELGIPSFISGTPAYETTAAETITNKHARYEDRINNIINNKTVEPITGQTQQFGFSGMNVTTDGGESIPPTFEANFNEQELAEYKDLYSRMQEGNPSLQRAKWDSPEAARAVSQYLSKNKNILRQNILITDDFINPYGDRSIGISKTDDDKISHAVYKNKDLRTYSVNGEVFTYAQLPSEIRQAFADKKVEYAGYYSAKNFLTDQYGEDSHKELFVSPISMKFTDESGDVKEVLVSRSTEERRKPVYKADMVFNDIFTNTNIGAGLPYKIPNTGDVAVFQPNGYGHIPGVADDKQYMINQIAPGGGYMQPIFLSENELHDKLYAAFGVQTPSMVEARNKAANKAANRR
jgi:hypothetical protein